MPLNTSTEPVKADRCPPWCVADHEAQHDPEDRWHHSVGHCVPIVEFASSFIGTEWMPNERGQDIELGLEQRVGRAEVYVHLGVGETGQHVRLSVESAVRLNAMLTALLGSERGV